MDKYRDYSEKCLNFINNVFDCGTSTTQNNTTALIALTRDEKINAVKSKVPFKLEKKEDNVFTTHLSRVFDFYGDISINLLPTEKVSKAVIKTEDTEILSYTNLHNGQLLFPVNKLFTLLCHDLYLEITFENLQYDRERLAWIDSYILNHSERIKMERVYGIVYKNSTQPIENTKEEQEIADMLTKMYHCPTCGVKASSICRCEQRDSKCANGHTWHYDPVDNKIILGQGKH